MRVSVFLFLCWAVVLSPCPSLALNGATPPRLEIFNGWKTFEIISEGDSPTGWVLPNDFDGAGAWLLDDSRLRIYVNHEKTGDSTITEVNIDLAQFTTSIQNTISFGTPNNIDFVQSANQAYDYWSDDLGETFQATSGGWDTNFDKFCSGQSYEPDNFGPNRGFVDPCYITGEEEDRGRLFVLDLNARILYQLSGAVGSAPNAGNGGMPSDSWENAALIDTGETSHISLVLPPDGGSEDMQLYIGHKGHDKNCIQASPPNFLERNGLACGSYYYLIGDLPSNANEHIQGGFSISNTNALSSGKLEDVDTSPSEPTRVVLGDETSGVFVLDFTLDFSGGRFNPSTSSFVITNIFDQSDGGDGVLSDADNVDWTYATTLGGISYPTGLIYVNEDEHNGEVWQINPDGSNPVRVARATDGASSSGIFDLSALVGYKPASIFICNTQGVFPSSLSVLIHPDAELLISLPTALPMPTPRPVMRPMEAAYYTSEGAKVYEAEDSLLEGVTIVIGPDSTFVDFEGLNSYAEWTVEILMRRNFQISVRYAATNSHPGEFIVDGENRGSFAFSQTGGWPSWEIETIALHRLDAGVHTLKIFFEGFSLGLKIDWLSIQPLVPSRTALTKGEMKMSDTRGGAASAYYRKGG
jgi:hypothetical protein